MSNPDPASPSEPDADASEARTLQELQLALGKDLQLQRPLGSGSAATVFLARERELGRLVAVKVLRSGKAGDETARLRFEREARAAASLSHPNVVQVLRFGRLPDETPYLVMRYVKGRTMEDRLAAEGRFTIALAMQVLEEVASALVAAHARGIVHRDVRPGNVLWDEEQQKALLSDFGIAALTATSGEEAVRLTQTGQMLGDPRYMSPEQLLDEEITELADMYGLGILGYELFAGEGPYVAKTNTQVITAHLKGEARDLRTLRPDADPRVADLLKRCLNREPRHRPSAADMVRVLRTTTGSDSRGSGGREDESDLQQLIKRRVPQIVVLAAGGGLGLMGLVDQLVDRDVLPDVSYRLTLPTAIAGVAAAAVVGWFHGEKGKQRARPVEWALLAIIGVAWVAAIVLILVA